MRTATLIAFSAAFLIALQANAQTAKQVEVINSPLAVEVVNPSIPAPPTRFQFVGFTSTTFDGGQGYEPIPRLAKPIS